MAEAVRQEGYLTKGVRALEYGYDSKVIWLTGLPCSGKSTIAQGLERRLHERRRPVIVLDGDNIRHGLNASPKILQDQGHELDHAQRFGLGFSQLDRVENIRRLGQVAKLFHDTNIYAITAFISPFKKDRDRARKIVKEGFVEIYVDTPPEICEQRDVKGMWKKARAGEIKGFTGVDDPYEPPENPELVLKTAELSVDECVAKIIEHLKIN
jgi:adenylylsulfate kinase